jgi:hypothetical protein
MAAHLRGHYRRINLGNTALERIGGRVDTRPVS